VVNLRLWVRPVYVFVRPGGIPAGTAALRVAFMPPSDLTVDTRKLADLLADVLGRPGVILDPFRNEVALKEELAAPQGSQYDAVVLYGEEPSPLIDRFLSAFAGGTPHLQVETSASSNTPSAGHMQKGSRRAADFRYAMLDYPSDTFYNKLPLSANTQSSGATVALPVRQDLSYVGLSLPLLLSNGRSKLSAPCWNALRGAIGDGALAEVAGSSGQPNEAQSGLRRELLTYALLAARGQGNPDARLEEILRGLALAGELQITRGEQAALLVEGKAGVNQTFKGAHKEIDEILKQKQISSALGVREEFSGSPPDLMQRARTKLYQRSPPTQENLLAAWSELLAAVQRNPQPAHFKPGNGLTKETDYNPYLDLANSWATGLLASRTARLDVPGHGNPSEFRMVSVALSVESGGSWEEKAPE
jgi:hypothetical protein